MLHFTKPEFYSIVFYPEQYYNAGMCLSSLLALAHKKEQVFSANARQSSCLVVCPQQNLNVGEENSTGSTPIHEVVSHCACWKEELWRIICILFFIWAIMVMQNLMRGEPEEEGWLGEAQGFIPCESGAVHPVWEQQHIKLSLVISVSSSGRCQGFLSW